MCKSFCLLASGLREIKQQGAKKTDVEATREKAEGKGATVNAVLSNLTALKLYVQLQCFGGGRLFVFVFFLPQNNNRSTSLEMD